MNPLRKLADFLGSFGLACLLLINLFLLTLFGTLYQVDGGLYEAQKHYFESWYVVGSSPLPHVLPGGLVTMGLLAVNLAVGGFVRLGKALARAPALNRKVSLYGVLVVHIGIALLLATVGLHGVMAFGVDGTLASFEDAWVLWPGTEGI